MAYLVGHVPGSGRVVSFYARRRRGNMRQGKGGGGVYVSFAPPSGSVATTVPATVLWEKQDKQKKSHTGMKCA
jgi:hypothetical protein